MNRPRRALTVLLCLALCLAALLPLSGCGKTGGYEKNPKLDLSQPVQLRIAGNKETWPEMDDVIAKFEEVYPNCTVTCEGIEEYTVNLPIRLAQTEEKVDIFRTVNIQEASEYRDHALNLISDEAREILDLSQANPGLVDNFRYLSAENTQYAVPYGGEMRGMYVNKTLLAAFGLEVPTNRAELLSCCQTLLEQGYIPLQSSSGTFAQQFLYPYICNSIVNGGSYEETYAALERIDDGISEYFRDAYSLLYEVVEKGYYDPQRVQEELGYTFSGSDGKARDFLDLAKVGEDAYEATDSVGKIAFLVDTQAFGLALAKVKSDYHSPIEYEFILSPVGENGGCAYLSPADGLAVNRHSDHTDWALEFLNFFFTPEIATAFAQATGKIPNTADALLEYDVPADRTCDVGQVTFGYTFYKTVTTPMLSGFDDMPGISRMTERENMQANPDGTYSIRFTLEDYLARLEKEFQTVKASRSEGSSDEGGMDAMTKREARGLIPTDDRIRRSALVTFVCDAVLILALVVCVLTYISRSNVNAYNQNADNVSNIAAAKAGLMLAALDNSSHEVKSAYRYCSGKSVTEALDYLSLIGDEDCEYQLLKWDEERSGDSYHVYAGYSTRKLHGAYQEIRYSHTDLSVSLHRCAEKEEGLISFSQTFTNKTDALRYFAVFCSVSLREDGGSQRYFLVKPQKESRVLDQLQMYSQYAELSTAICYSDGRYLARDSSFRSTNFYDYLYDYNDLSIDQRDAVRASVQSDTDGAGLLRFSDYKGRDCVFAYAACAGAENWNVIAAVPVAEFVSGQLLSFFPAVIIAFLLVLLAFNTWRLLLIVRELRRSVERERVASRAKSSFLSRMSHEIRTPLNAVIGYNAIAKNDLSGARTDAERRQAEMKVMDCLNKGELASRHLLTIINDVLDMSAIESGRINVAHDRFDFKGLITSLTTVFYSQARAKDVEFEVAFGTLTEEWFVGDQMRTNQILTNLLSNAVKFTPAGGSVTLRISQPEAEENASHIRFEVCDTGIGMAPEYLSRIWVPFEQADSSISRRFGGTGLGLSITKSLVDLMGGSISVESQPGKGSTFRVDLTFGRTEQPLNSSAYNFGSVSALVADDDPDTCDYIRLLFNRCGARCAAVSSGADALKAVSVARERGERFSLCLLDWRMPEMDGIETAGRLRELVGDELPLIVLTAYDYSELADRAAQAGVTRFLSKPLFPSSLFDLLANVSGAQPAKDRQQSSKVDFGGARVLLAEDNMMNMEIARTILSSAGLAVDGAWNGQEAVTLFDSAAAGTYAAILMDVHMPVMDGHEATRLIRASSHPEAQTVPIIAMTADAFAENVAEARAAGMNDHIAKPIDIAHLFDTLKKYIPLPAPPAQSES